MKIKSVELINLKSYSHSKIELSPNINLLIGANNSGKSTIIKSLLNLQYHTFDKKDIRSTEEYSKTFIEINEISEKEMELLDAYLVRFSIQKKVHLKKAAEPYSIVSSIASFDIGLLGELPEEENQLLTSSNKLFDYIHAGLAVISPNLPGLNETILDNDLGITYETGNPNALAEAIDYLVNNKKLLEEYKAKSSILAKSELFWENDYEKVWNEMIKDNSQ